jgi:hypothetical protein
VVDKRAVEISTAAGTGASLTPPVDVYVRWQDHARSELAFVNNLLIGLAAGLIAVALAAGADVARLRHIAHWERLCSGIGVVFLGISMLAGVGLAVNRLQAARLTARLVRIRELRNRTFDGDGWARRALWANIHGLTHWEHWTRREIRRTARQATQQGSKNLSKDMTDRVVAELREWAAGRADPRIWRFVRVQLWLFIIGALLLVLTPVLNYFEMK